MVNKIIISCVLMTFISTNAFSEIIKKITKTYSDGDSKEVIYYDNVNEIARESFDNYGNIIETTGTVPNGVVKEYYSTGKIRALWEYRTNKLNGKSKIYSQDGKLKYEYLYKNGVLIKSNSGRSYTTDKYITAALIIGSIFYLLIHNINFGG